MAKKTYTLLAADKQSESNINEASWIAFTGKGLPIDVYLDSVEGPANVMSAINAISDWHYAEKYSVESVRGLHLLAGKHIDDEFAGKLGYIHVNYNGKFQAPSLADYPLGWAQLGVMNGIVSISEIPDMRTKEELNTQQPTDVLTSRKHNWIDAILTGRPIRIQIGYMRKYIADRLEKWEGHTPEEVRQSRRVAIVAHTVDVNVTRPAYREAKAAVARQASGYVEPVAPAPQPAPEVVLPEHLLFKVKGSEDLYDLMAETDSFFPIVYKSNGQLACSGDYRWDPSKPNPILVKMFETWAAAGYVIKL